MYLTLCHTHPHTPSLFIHPTPHYSHTPHPHYSHILTLSLFTHPTLTIHTPHTLTVQHSHTLTIHTLPQACAPLYINRPTIIQVSGVQYQVADPNGRCIILDSDLNSATPLQLFSGDVPSLRVAGVDTGIVGQVTDTLKHVLSINKRDVNCSFKAARVVAISIATWSICP